MFTMGENGHLPDFMKETIDSFRDLNAKVAAIRKEIWTSTIEEARANGDSLPEDVEEVGRAFMASEICLTEMFWRLITTQPKPTLDEFFVMAWAKEDQDKPHPEGRA